MSTRRPALSFGIVLGAGIVLGWTLAGGWTPRKLLANGADRWGDRAFASGHVVMETASVGKDRATVPLPVDALYYLNYSTGKLLAAVPMMAQIGPQRQFLTEFAERDLMADFTVKPGANPKFLMTTAGLGASSGGTDLLFVLETETGQIATYRVEIQATAGSNRARFEMLERRVDPRLARTLMDPGSR